MNLLRIQNRINQLMARWVASLKGAASMSRTDLNLVSETILVPLLREVYDLPDLRNLNTESANFPGIDLADDNARVAIQVTSTATSAKVKHTLSEFVKHELFEQYDHLIVYILVEKQRTYSGKGFDDIIGRRFAFDKEQDIRDYRDLLGVIQDFQIDRAERILDILEANFGGDAQPPTLSQVPRPLAEFVGRTDELDRLEATLKPGTKAAITGLVGMGGLGKTELAKPAASRVAHRFRDGVLWADCAEQDLVAIADLWAAAYEKQLPGDSPDAKAAAWRGLISAKETLLIFDNLQPGQRLEPLFPPSGRTVVLITTRHGNHPDLRGAERLDLDIFTLEEATALTEKTLGKDQARDQAGDATHLFELLGYLPLAISVALHLADKFHWSLATLGAKLEAAGALAVLGDKEALKKSLNATFQTAWDNLPKDLQEAFRTLALFNQGPTFSTQALADTLELNLDDAGVLLHRLAGRSLVTEETTVRWSLTPLLREFVDTLGPVDEVTHLRLARHYERVARAANDLYKQGGDNALQALALFDLEWPHIRAGQAGAAAHAEADDEAARLCSAYPDAAAHILSLRLHPRDRIAWLETALQAAGRLGDQRAEDAHLGSLGLAYAALGETHKAIGYHTAALEIAKEIGDRRNEGAGLGNLGNAYRALGETHKAIDHYQQALEIAKEIGDRRGEGAYLGNLGLAYAALGETHKAIEHHTAALEISREIGDRRGEGAHLGSLGLAYADLGETHKAIDYYQQALGISKEIGDRRNEGAHLGSLGLAYADLGDTHKAIDYYQQALEIAKEIGDRRNEGTHPGNLGNAYADLGETHKAIDYYQQALEIAKEIGDRRNEGIHLGNLGNAYAALGETHKAIEYHTAALEIAKEIGDRRGEGAHLGNLGNAYRALGETHKAIDHYQQALEIAKEIGDRRNEGIHLGNLGLAYADLGETPKAIDYYQQALEIAKEIGDRRNEGIHLGNLGRAYAALGETHKAIDYYQQALEIAKEIGDRRGEGAHLGNLGLAYANLGETVRARDYLTQALAIFEAISDPNAERVRQWLAALND